MSERPRLEGVDQPDLDVAIGRFFRAWTLLEHSLQMYLACLLLTDQWRAKIVWKNAGGMTSRLRLIKDLVKNFIMEPEQERVLKLVKRLERDGGLIEARNTLAHCGLYLDRDGKTVKYSSPEISRKDGNALFYDPQSFDLDELRNWETEINSLVFEFGARGNFGGANPDLQIEREPSTIRNK